MDDCCCNHEERIALMECQLRQQRNAILWLQQQCERKKMVKRYGSITTIALRSLRNPLIAFSKHKSLALTVTHHATHRVALAFTKHKGLAVTGRWNGLNRQAVAFAKHKSLAVTGAWHGTTRKALAFTKHKGLALTWAWTGTRYEAISFAKDKGLALTGTHRVVPYPSIAFSKHKSFSASGLWSGTHNASLAFSKQKGLALTGLWSGLVPGTEQMPTIWPDEGVVLAGNGLTFGVDTAVAYNWFSYQNPAANGDQRKWNFWLPQGGTWTLYMLCSQNTDRGKLDTKIDGVAAATGIDMYFASPLYNQTFGLFTGTLAAGLHTLETTVNGKNVLSSGYSFVPNKFWAQAP